MRSAGGRNGEGEHSDARPRDEVAGREKERRDRRAALGHASSRAQPSAPPTETSSPPSSRPTRRQTRRASRDPSTAHRPCPASRRPSTTSPTAARTRRRAMSPSRVRAAANAGASPPVARRAFGALRRSSAQAAHENSEAESPDFPSYSMPKALIFDRVASAIVKFGRDRVEHADRSAPAARSRRRTGRCPRPRSRSHLRCGRCGGRLLPRPRSALARRRAPRRRAVPSPSIGPPFCPPKTARQLLHLLVGRVLVDEHAETPVALRHDLGGVRDHGDLTPADVCSLDLTLGDVEDESGAAVVVRRTVVEREVARAHELAGARLEVGPLEIPGHRNPPSSADRAEAILSP